MNLVNKEYHKRAKVLLENWQDSGVLSSKIEAAPDVNWSSIVELSLLAPEASISEINKMCKTASKYSLSSICVNPAHVQRCVQVLSDDLPVGTVIGFPLGSNHHQIKVAEAELAVAHGAKKLNMVINIGLLKTSNFQEVFEEIRSVRYACPEADLTVILETGLLEPLQIIIACMLCREAGVDDVMTSTGFSQKGATPEGVSLMRSVLGDDLGVVASGGIKNRENITRLLSAGATRLSLPFYQTDESIYGLFNHSDRPVDE